MITKGQALFALRPGAEWNVLDGKIEWLDSEQTQPTEEEIVQKIAELEYTEEVEDYKRVRELAYPSTGEQFDKIFHEGIDALKAGIQAIKDAHPKAVIDTDELAARKATALADYQAEEYIKATARLAQYQLSVGVPESSETIVTGQEWNEEAMEMQDVTETVVIPAIPALEATVEVTTYDFDTDTSTTETVANPLITKDIEERAAAQVIIDNTPQPVKDQVNGG